MMKTTDAAQGHRLACFGWVVLKPAARRSRLLQTDVRSVCVVVGDVFTPQSPEVLIVQRDYVIEHFAANCHSPQFYPIESNDIKGRIRI
jgi:hypothetical protein